MSVTVVMRFVSPLAEGVTSAIIMSLFLCFLPAISQTSWPPTTQGVQLVGGATQGVAGVGRKLPCAGAAGICVHPIIQEFWQPFHGWGKLAVVALEQHTPESKQGAYDSQEMGLSW